MVIRDSLKKPLLFSLQVTLYGHCLRRELVTANQVANQRGVADEQTHLEGDLGEVRKELAI